MKRLSPTMYRMLENAAACCDLKRGLRGRSEHGGANGTIGALLRRGLIISRHGGITDAGRAALEYDQQRRAKAANTPPEAA
ncbi:MAG: hypothetical protein V9G63_09995 [Candidatus Competibacter sp.]|jgi:hypothetical protein